MWTLGRLPSQFFRKKIKMHQWCLSPVPCHKNERMKKASCIATEGVV
jgi:hypothetical protein